MASKQNTRTTIFKTIVQSSIFAVLTLICFLSGDATAATYYVATDGNNSNSGSSTQPWRTIQFAADRAVAGDTVVVRPGQYVGFVLGWDFPQNGTAAQPITFRGESGAIINSRNLRTPDGINLEGASYIVIEGFTVTGLPRAGIRSVLNHHVTIRNNIGDQNNSWGILTGFSDDLLIEGNTMTRSAVEHGIYVGNSGDRPTIRGNIIWGNRANGIHINSDRFAGGDGVISNALVEENIIYNNGLGGGSGINCDGVQNSIIRNNLLYDNHASGISLYKIDGAQGASGNLVINNTIVQASDGRWAINISDGSINNTIRNNIMFSFHSFRGGLTVDAASLSGLVSDYNLGINRYSRDGGSSVLTLAGWRAATGQDSHSLISTPNETFSDFANRDLHLAASSTAIDSGTSLGAPATDLDGNSRSSGNGPDIGAYEWVEVCDPSGGGGGGELDPPPTNDDDGDGISNSSENTDGTDPLDAGSYLTKVTSPVYTVWNGFLQMIGVLELVNSGTTNADVTVSLFTQSSGFCNKVVLTLAPGEQRDLIINDIAGFARDAYGILKISFTGKIDGRVLSYRTGAAVGSYEFAYGLPLRNPTYGPSAVTFNTYQPSLNIGQQVNPVANWLTIINLAQQTKQFRLDYFDQTGSPLFTAVESIPAQGRADRQAGHEVPGKDRVGLIVVTPLDAKSPYLAHNTRYGYGNPAGSSFDFAFPLLTRAGTGRAIAVPITSTLSAGNWVELSNTLAVPTSATIQFYASNGQLLSTEFVALNAREQRHFDASRLLGANRTGFALVLPSARNSIIAQSMVYVREPVSGSILAMYGSQAVESRTGSFFTSYNRFLGMANWLKVINPTNSALNATIRVHHQAGFTDRPISLGANSSADIAIHDETSFPTLADTYGIVEVQTTGQLTAEMLRVHTEPMNGRVDFLTPLPLP